MKEKRSLLMMLKKLILWGVPIVLAFISGGSFFMFTRPGGDLGALLYFFIATVSVVVLILYLVVSFFLYKLLPCLAKQKITDRKSLFISLILLIGWLFFIVQLLAEIPLFNGFGGEMLSIFRGDAFWFFIVGGGIGWSIITFLFYRYPNLKWKHFLGTIIGFVCLVMGVYAFFTIVPDLFKENPKSYGTKSLEDILDEVLVEDISSDLSYDEEKGGLQIIQLDLKE